MILLARSSGSGWGRTRSTRIRNSIVATAFAAVLLALLGGCASGQPDLAAMDRKIDVERFMGDWYVLAFIPIDLVFFSEAGAHGAVENYQLDGEGKIDITYTFRDGSFEADPTVMTQRGRVIEDGRGTEWRVQVFWPFESAYLIAWLDADYERAIIGVPSRSNVWILSRDPLIDEVEFSALTSRVANLGYDPTMIRRVPQRAENP